MSNIICISFQSGIPEYVSEHLMNAAINMFQNKNDFSKIEGATYGGGITTAFRSVVFGGISGIEFIADLEIEVDGRTQKNLIKYLVQPAILMAGHQEYNFVQQSAWEFLQGFLRGVFEEMSAIGLEDTIGPTAGSC